MAPYSLTNFEKNQNKPKLNGVFSRDNLPKIKDGTGVINVGEFNKSIRTHWIALYGNSNNIAYF